MKKVVLVLICILLLATGCDAEFKTEGDVLGAYGAATDSKKEDQSHILTELNMLYYSDMDQNPATTNCLANHELLKFVYSPLITVNAGFEPICILAESWKLDSNKATVKIKSGLKFSNGESVTANDVIKSINAVKYTPTSPYYNSASALYKYYKTDDLTVVFEFKTVDVDCIAMLDFPIMYNGKAGYGCGAYVFSEQGGKPVLVPNESYFEKASVPVIHLIETKDDGYIDDLFSAGTLDIISSSVIEELSLTSLRDYNIVSCPSNRFIYLGVNFYNQKFADYEVRKAISTIIDRKKLAKQSLVDLASPTEYPFNPEWSKIKKITDKAYSNPSEKQIIAAAKVLKDIPITLTVPAKGYKNNIAKEIVGYFKSAGITITLKELEADAYAYAISTGNFELYLGECAVPKNNDPTFLYGSGGAMNYGGYSDAELDTAFHQYKSGEIELKEYLKEFKNRLPVIPIAYGKSVLYCAQGIAGFSDRSAFNIYGNAARITLKK